MQNDGTAIRHQLLTWVLTPLICLCGLSALFAYHLASVYATEWHDAYLVNSADSIAARLYRNERGVALADIPVAAKAVLKHNGQDVFYYQIIDSNGHRLSGDAELPAPIDLHFRGPKFRYGSLNGNPLRICRIPVDLGPTSNVIWVQVGESLNSRQQFLSKIVFSIMIPQLALVALASISVWWGIKHGLKPLDRLGKLLKTRSNLDFTPLNIGNTPKELGPVISALNEHFAKTGKFLNSQRQFTGNAAHQLRTPITALSTYVECAKKVKDGQSVNDLLDRISEAADRTGHIIGRLLALARSEGRICEPELVDIVLVVTDVGACLVPQALKKNLELSFDVPQDRILIQGNRGDMEELIVNLLDNAITYTPEFGSITLELKEQDDDHVVLSIEDTGPGIPDEQKEKIFERFYRAPNASTGGCGLGLSIVSEVAKLFKTRVEVTDGEKGGAKFAISFLRILPTSEQRRQEIVLK